MLRHLMIIMAFLTTPVVANSPATPGDRLILVGTQLAEIVFAIGAGEQVVATHGYREHIKGISSAAPIRGFGPTVRSAETLLAFRPSAIWYMEGGIDMPTLAALKALGIPLHGFPNGWQLTEVPRHVRSMAAALGRVDAGEALIGKFQASLQSISEMPPITPPPSGIFILAGGNRPLLTAGHDSDFHRLITLAGGKNASVHRGYQLLSAEEMLRIAPEIIFLLPAAISKDQTPGIAALPGVSLTPAARDGRYIAIEGHCLTDFGIETPACVQRLRHALLQVGQTP